MTLDDRIEALTHNVELLSRMHQDNEARYPRMFEQLADSHQRLSRQVRGFMRTAQTILLDDEGRLRAIEGDGMDPEELDNGEAQ